MLNGRGRTSQQLPVAEKYKLTIEHEQNAIGGEAPARLQSYDLQSMTNLLFIEQSGI